ncbi:MAG: hypothetical protein RBR71_05055 [Gudongella sp.]|nr:hypothetical protein [Gudongella sp.]
MKKSSKRILMFCISLLMVLSNTISGYTPVMAASGNSVIVVSKNKSYKKDDGNFYMSFNFTNNDKLIEGFNFQPILLNSSGKIVVKWKPFSVSSGQSFRRDFGYNYGQLPTGESTFILTAKSSSNTLQTYGWKYKIKHTCSSAISFKPFEKVIDSKGIERNKFSIQCTNIKGKELTIKIIDSNGNLVFEQIGPARKTNNEVGWFAWDGYANMGSWDKCKSGQYTVEVHYSGGSKIIQNTYNLII